MSNLAGLLRSAAAGGVAFVFALVFELRSAPLILSGSNLGVIGGHSADPHLLTGWFWPKLAVGWLHAPATLFTLNAAIFAVAVAIFAVVVERKRGAVAAALAALALATSPLAVPGFIDPLGAESTLALMLFFVLAADAGGALTLGLWARALLPAALVAQDPLYIPAALAYSAPLLRARSAPALGPLAGVLAICALRGMLHAGFRVPGGLPAFDAIAGPPALVLAGVLTFLVLPAAVFGWRRGLYRMAGFTGGSFLPVAGLAGACLLAAMFSWTGDPSSCWLAAEAAFILALFCAFPAVSVRPYRIVAVTLVILIFAGSVLGMRFWRHAPAVDLARQSVQILDAAKKAGRSPLCLAADGPAQAHVLAGGAFLRLYLKGSAELSSVTAVRDCPRPRNQREYLVTADQRGVTDWDDSGLELTLATDRENRARFVITDSPGDVAPKTHVNLPGGYGTFGNTEPTANEGVTTMTVTAGFSEVYKCVDASAPGHLLVLGANPVANGDVARMTVSAASRGTRPRVLLTHDFRGHRVGRRPDWRSIDVALHGQPCTDITFRVDPINGQVTGSWVTFIAMVTERD